MSTEFQDGDLIEAGHLKQYSGEAYYSVAGVGSTSSAYLATVTPAPLSAYPVGMVVNFKANADNAASPTLNVNGLGAKAIVKNGSTALAAADIKNGQVISLVYDGTNFQLVAASAGGGSSVVALTDLSDVTISGAAPGQVLRKSSGTDWENSAIQAGDLPSRNHDGSQITTGQVAPARLSSNAPNASQFLRGDGTWAAVSGGSSDLNGLTDVTISGAAPGQVLRKSSAGDWENSAIQAGDLPSHNHDGSQITTGQVAPARLSSNAPNASQFLRGDGTWAAVSGGSSDLNGLTDVTISGAAPGQVLRKSSAGDWENSAIQASDLPAGIDAINIGSGTVSNSEFGALDGVTGSIQTQLNGKAASSHTHAAADITSGQLGLARGGTGADLSATGGTGQVLKQSTAGGAVSVGALGAGDMPSGIDAAKIGGGAVSNIEFATLDGVTSAIQTQLDGKAASSHTHAAADITSGVLATARLGTGTASTSTFLRGDGTWAAAGGGSAPIGMIAPFAGSTVPTGWLLCYGQNVSRTTYAALFAALGTTFGSGSGSTTFGLPDLRGRVVAGLNNMGGTSASALNAQSWSSTLGQFGVGGSQSHTLSTVEMPSHSHSTIAYGYFNAYVANQALNAVQNYTQGFVTTGATGGSGGVTSAHNNVQPTMVLNYIIYAGV